MSENIDKADHGMPVRRKTSVTFWLIAAVVVLCVVLAVVKALKPDRGNPADDAKRVCQEDFIPKRLKAPATAKYSDVSVTSNATVYTVTGSVDSQNTFGATVRAKFTCVVESSDGQWVLQSATVTG